MNLPKHITAKPSHYNKEALTYDAFNEKKSLQINQLIERTLAKYWVNSVVDLSCGTGSQAFFLAKNDYQVVGYDINSKMLSIAKEKAKKQNLNIKFIKDDMRNVQAGKFDAAITIFNAIGHLTKADFKKTIRNIHTNLNDRGIYIFDIFNLSYLLKDDNITKLTIDWQKQVGDTISREIQYSTIDPDGVLASHDIYIDRIGNSKPKISNAYQTLQVYSKDQLKELMERNGFKVLRQCNVDGSRFSTYKSERILTVAMKLEE